MKNKKLFIAIGFILGIGLISQIVEKNLDKPAIQTYVETNFKEQADSHDTFDFSDEEESNIIEWLGF